MNESTSLLHRFAKAAVVFLAAMYALWLGVQLLLQMWLPLLLIALTVVFSVIGWRWWRWHRW